MAKFQNVTNIVTMFTLNTVELLIFANICIHFNDIEAYAFCCEWCLFELRSFSCVSPHCYSYRYKWVHFSFVFLYLHLHLNDIWGWDASDVVSYKYTNTLYTFAQLLSTKLATSTTLKTHKTTYYMHWAIHIRTIQHNGISG